MKITLAERHMQVSEALRSYALAKVEHLSRYFDDGIITVDVMLEAEKERQICELVAHLVRKKILKASAEAEDMHAAIDAAIDKLKTQLSRYKGRLREKRSQGKTREAPSEADQSSRELQRVQVYLKKPMTPEEAILQLESYQKKDFLIFMDAEREALSILRRLSDGRYELLEPVY